MYLQELAKSITEGQATAIILDAARANEERKPRTVRGHRIRFEFRGAGSHTAYVRNPDGCLVAVGVVDTFDC